MWTRSGANASGYPHRGSNADRYAYADQHTHAYADQHTHAYADQHAHTYADQHAHTYADQHAHTYAPTRRLWDRFNSHEVAYHSSDVRAQQSALSTRIPEPLRSALRRTDPANAGRLHQLLGGPEAVGVAG